MSKLKTIALAAGFTYAISDKTLRFRTIRDEVKNTQYASKSLNNDGTVFIGVQENGQQESRSVILTKEYGAVGIRKIGDKTLISNKLGDFFHDNTSGRIDFNSKEGLSAKFAIISPKKSFCRATSPA